MNEQKYKIVDVETEGKVFFFDHSFKTALFHARQYIKRVKGDCILYRRNTSSFGDLWIEVKTHRQEGR